MQNSPHFCTIRKFAIFYDSREIQVTVATGNKYFHAAFNF